jgi:hypothetical protein
MLLLGCSATGSEPGYGSGAGGTGGPSLGDAGAILGNGGAEQGGFDVCAKATNPAVMVPLDMYLLLDHSQSMLIGGAWELTVEALASFVDLPDLDGISLGVGFFPLPVSAPVPSCQSDSDCDPYAGPCEWGKCNRGDPITDSCLAEDYATPAVPFAPLPDVGPAVNQAMASLSPEGTTPMVPALRGAVAYVSPWAKSHPAHITAIVLATDGMPSVCYRQDVSDVAQVAAEAFAHDPPIKTFVVGYGMGDALDSIAQAGGTVAIDVNVSTADSELLAALNEIRKLADCRYQIPPPPPGENLQFQLVNVVHRVGGTETTIPKVEDASACGSQPGWYYDDEAAPTQIVLCPSTCETVKVEQGDLEIVLGCQTVVR